MTALYITLAIAGYLAVGFVSAAIARCYSSLVKDDWDAGFITITGPLFWIGFVIVEGLPRLIRPLAKLALYLGDKCRERRKP